MKASEFTFSIADHGPVFAALLAEPRLAPLGPGTPNESMRSRLAALDVSEAFAPHMIADLDMMRACLAGLWLYHDFLPESHGISQEINTPTGSYWHGLLHRREPDFANSKYWFNRVGRHPVFEPLRQEAARQAAGASGEAAFLTTQKNWDPFAFVDLCESSYAESSRWHALCRQIQHVEWQLLFDHSFRGAIGL